jgi:hypothetical protein
MVRVSVLYIRPGLHVLQVVPSHREVRVVLTAN